MVSSAPLLGVVLVPDEVGRATLTGFAQRLLPTVAAVQMVLGDNAIPHVSLAHVESDSSTQDSW